MKNLAAISTLIQSALTAGVTILLAFSVLVLSAVLPAAAQTTQWNGSQSSDSTQWNGSQSSDWFDPANWSNGVPDAGTEARIAWFGGSSPVLTTGTTIRRLNMGSNNQTLTIAQGAELNIVEDVAIGNSGTLNVADGTVVVNQASTVGGRITVGDGEISFLDDFTFNGSGKFTVQTGTVNIGSPGPPVISADFTLAGNTDFFLNEGTLNIFGNSAFTASGRFHAGSGNINLDGNITLSGNTNFNPETSTVTITGESTINVTSNIDGNTIFFYDLVIEEGADVTAIANVTVNNNMTVDDEANYIQEAGTNLNVVGEVIGEPLIDADRPYIISITINSGTSISAIFDEPLNAGPAETASNYHVEDASGNTIDNPTDPVLGGSQSNVVTLTLGFTIQEGVNYFLIVNNVSNLNNQTVNEDHRKRFRIAPAPVFYSRDDGDWGDVESWSRDSHSGGIADRIPGQSADQVVIGDSHTITISSSDGTVALQPLASVVVDPTGTLRVADGGVLATGTRAVQGDGTFELEAGGTLQIGSPDGITAVSNSGNIRTAIRLFSEAAHYIYNGTPVQFTGSGLPAQVASFTLDNGNGVTLSADLTVSGTLYLIQGVLTIPSGGHLVANDKQPDPADRNGSLRFLRQITGSKGWRLMSSPVATDFADFVAGPQGGFTTQGFAGADLPNQMPNILHFAEDTPESPDDTVTTNMAWRSIGALSDAVVPGRGYFIYVFNGAGGPDSNISGRDDELPFTISASGQENEPSGTPAVFDFNVSHTARQLYTEDSEIYTEDSGWNLVGNPFGAALDWNHSSWSKTNMHESIYVWDPSANGGNGEYRNWNGLTGSLGSGLIAPFQAFWVKAEDESASLTVTADAKTTGSAEPGYMGFFGRTDDGHADPVDGAFGSLNSLSTHHHGTYHHEIVMELRHLSSGFRTDSRLMFSPYGDRQGDSYDAYRLIPLTNTYLSLFTVRENGSQLVINSLNDRVDERFSIPMEAYGAYQGMPLGGSALIEWGDLSGLPEELSVMLHDTKTGETVNMRTKRSYAFDLESSPAFAAKQVAATNLAGHAMSTAPAGDTSGALSNGTIPDGGSQVSGALAAGTGQQDADCSTGVTGADGRCENDSAVIVNQPGAPFLFKQSSRPADTRFRILIDRRIPSQYGGEIPDRVRLDQNYPNPFNPGTTLRFALPEESRVRLAVYDVLGRLVAMPADGVYTAGVHEIGWEPRGLSSGTYIYRLEAGGQVQTRKMMLLK